MATELIYQSSKTYNHSSGFSCVFRQHKAKSHCSKLHGYALKIELVWEGDLDDRNWVMDFGDLKRVKQFLELAFDHTVIAAEDDPFLETLREWAQYGIVDLRVLPAVGCEKFAEYIFKTVDDMFMRSPSQPNWPLLQSVQVWEHEANSAKVIRKPDMAKEVNDALVILGAMERHG